MIRIPLSFINKVKWYVFLSPPVIKIMRGRGGKYPQSWDLFQRQTITFLPCSLPPITPWPSGIPSFLQDHSPLGDQLWNLQWPCWTLSKPQHHGKITHNLLWASTPKNLKRESHFPAVLQSKATALGQGAFIGNLPLSSLCCYDSRQQKALIPQPRSPRPYCTTGSGVESQKTWFEGQPPLPLTRCVTLSKLFSPISQFLYLLNGDINQWFGDPLLLISIQIWRGWGK